MRSYFTAYRDHKVSVLFLPNLSFACFHHIDTYQCEIRSQLFPEAHSFFVCRLFCFTPEKLPEKQLQKTTI